MVELDGPEGGDRGVGAEGGGVDKWPQVEKVRRKFVGLTQENVRRQTLRRR